MRTKAKNMTKFECDENALIKQKRASSHRERIRVSDQTPDNTSCNFDLISRALSLNCVELTEITKLSISESAVWKRLLVRVHKRFSPAAVSE